MADFDISLNFRSSTPTESELMELIVNALKDAGYYKETWQHEGEHFYGDFTIEIQSK